MSLNWSQWYSLYRLAEQKWEIIPESPGVYVIRWGVEGKSKAIPRAGGVDEEGIIYIGRSKNLRRRIKQFWTNVVGKYAPHIVGITYREYKFHRVFKPNELEVSWAVVHSAEALKDIEC